MSNYKFQMTNGLMSNITRVTKGPALFLFALLVVVDQLSKFFATDVYRNADFAFSLRVSPYLMYAVYAVVLSAIVFYLLKFRRKLELVEAVSWLMILAGGVSNLTERILLGYVRDFIYFFGGVFNLADFYIMMGVILLLGRELILKRR